MTKTGLIERNRKFRIGACLLVVSLIGAACQPVFGINDPPVNYGILTSGSGLHYSFSGDTVTVTAAAGSPFPDGNVREVFWRDDRVIWYANQESCITWESTTVSQDPGPSQPGIALRIAPTGANNEGIKAITVTENIFYGGVWFFNVHIWDSTAEQAFTQLASFDLASVVVESVEYPDGTEHLAIVPPPWHICAVAMGDQFSFKVWTGTNPEPSWTDPTRVYTTTLPDGWNYPGYSGGYVGHLHEGTSAPFSGESSAPACADPVLQTTQACQDLINSTPPNSTATVASLTTTSTAPPTSTTTPVAPAPTTTAPLAATTVTLPRPSVTPPTPASSGPPPDTATSQGSPEEAG